MRPKDFILWILVIIAIIISIWYLLGNSPTLEQALLILILTILYATSTKISDMGSRLYLIERRFNNLEKSFIKMVNDFRRLKS